MQKNNFFFALLIISFFWSNTVFSQNARDIHIKFSVNAEVIFHGGNVGDNSVLTDDNNGTSQNGRPSDFESEAYPSKFVNWEISDLSANEQEYQLKFLDFPWSGSVAAFAQNPIPGGGKKAKAKIEDNASDGTIKYTIRFTIKSRATGETRTFQLDPKIRVINR